MVAALARRFGDLDIAEVAAAEAFATAVGRWPAEPTPNPSGWLTTTARRPRGPHSPQVRLSIRSSSRHAAGILATGPTSARYRPFLVSVQQS